MTGPEADLEGMGTQARIRVERDYSVDQHLEQLLAIYTEVQR